jgi:glycosyltransferase involved in cell wall biosynthesis
MAAVIREETGGAPYDIVQIEFTFMGQYAPCVRSGRTVLRAHDLAYRPAYRNAKRAGSLPARAWAALEWCRWARYEPAVALAHDHVFTVTEQDRALLERLAPGVSASYQAMGLDVPEEVRPFERRERSALLFVGALGHAPNADAALWLASEIFPIVRGRIPDAVLRIAGRGASPALLAAAARNPGIELLGFVDDLASVLWSASVFVAPLRSGGGIKTKIIQAMGYGMPVVTTPVGAEGIEGAQAAGLLLGRSARELAEGVLTLLADPRGSAARAARGRALVLEEYTWERTGRRQEQRYESLLSQQPS